MISFIISMRKRRRKMILLTFEVSNETRRQKMPRICRCGLQYASMVSFPEKSIKAPHKQFVGGCKRLSRSRVKHERKYGLAICTNCLLQKLKQSKIFHCRLKFRVKAPETDTADGKADRRMCLNTQFQRSALCIIFMGS